MKRHTVFVQRYVGVVQFVLLQATSAFLFVVFKRRFVPLRVKSFHQNGTFVLNTGLIFFEENGFTWDRSEEAIEGTVHMIDRYPEQSAFFIGHEKKTYGHNEWVPVAVQFQHATN